MMPERIGIELKEVPDWTLEEAREAIGRNFHFTDFDESISFVNAVAAISREHDHFPAIDVRVNQVKVRLTTPEADGLTDTDFALAKIFDRWARNHWDSL